MKNATNQTGRSAGKKLRLRGRREQRSELLALTVRGMSRGQVRMEAEDGKFRVEKCLIPHEGA